MIELHKTQQIYKGLESVKTALKEVSSKHYMLVHDPSFHHLPVKDYIKPDVVFNDFTSNPLYEQVCNGVKVFNDNHCDAIVAVPTTYNQFTEDELASWGINVVIYANHMLRAAYPAMMKVARSILENHRAQEARDLCMPIKEILELIPGTK